MVLQELAGFTHLTTRMKLVPGAEQDPTLSPEERATCSAEAASSLMLAEACSSSLSCCSACRK